MSQPLFFKPDIFASLKNNCRKYCNWMNRSSLFFATSFLIQMKYIDCPEWISVITIMSVIWNYWTISPHPNALTPFRVGTLWKFSKIFQHEDNVDQINWFILVLQLILFLPLIWFIFSSGAEGWVPPYSCSVSASNVDSIQNMKKCSLSGFPLPSGSTFWASGVQQKINFFFSRIKRTPTGKCRKSLLNSVNLH